jgi:hypothetical protein
MTVVMDREQRFYIVVSIHDGMVRLIERCDSGPVELRRHRGEELKIGVRSVPEKTVVMRDDLAPKKSVKKNKKGEEEMDKYDVIVKGYEDLFSIVENATGGYVAKVWLKNGSWAVTDEAREILDRVIYIEDTFNYLAFHHAERNVAKALKRAHKIAKKARRSK